MLHSAVGHCMNHPKTAETQTLKANKDGKGTQIQVKTCRDITKQCNREKKRNCNDKETSYVIVNTLVKEY